MTRDALYELAFRYRKTKLWTQLHDTQVFAVRTENDETAFVCIMGRIGEHISVAVYPEDEFYSYYHFLDAEQDFDILPTPKALETFMSSSCIQCSFENKDMLHPSELDEVRAYAKSHGIRIAGKNAFPQFTRYTPYHYPWSVDSEHDRELLAAGLEAAIALSDEVGRNFHLGEQLCRIDDKSVQEVPVFVHTPQGYSLSGMAALPGRRNASYPSGDYSNEVLLKKIRSKRSKGTIDCRVIWLNKATQDHPGEPPYYPAALIAVEESNGTVMSMSLTKDYESGYNSLLADFMAALADRKSRPSKVMVQNARTYMLLADTMEKASIEIGQKSDLPYLDEAVFALYDHLEAGAADSAEANYAGNSGSEAADFSQMEKGLEMMLSEIEAMGDELLKYLPQDVTEALSAVSSAPGVPSALKERIDSLLRRLDGLTPNNHAGPDNTRGKGTAGSKGSTSGKGTTRSKGSTNGKDTTRSGRSGKGKKSIKGRDIVEEPLSYVISVSPYTGCYRHIRVSADITLEEFHNIIQAVFAFDNDHLYAFFMDNKAWSYWDAYFSPQEEDERSASDYRLRDTALYKGKKFLYLFDFGDEWCFECRVLRAITEDTTGYQILRSKGEAPEQYPDYYFDDDDDEDEDPFW